MIKGWQWWTLTLVALLAGVLVVVNGALFAGNRQAQSRIDAQARFVQQTAQLDRAHREIVTTLAELSPGADNLQLRNLLAANGFVAAGAPSGTAPLERANKEKKR